MSPLAAALTTVAIFVGSAAVVGGICWLLGSSWAAQDERRLRPARRPLTAWEREEAERAAYQKIRNPLGYPPEGHLCLACLGYFVALEPPDYKLCAACRRGGP